MPISVTWTAIPNGIENGKLKIVAMATIKLTSASTAETTLGASFPTMLNWHKNKFSFTLTFAGAMGVKTFNVGPLAVPSQQAWPSLFKSDTPVRPYKYEAPVNKWESYSVTRLLESTKTSYAAVAAQSTIPKYAKVTDLITQPFKVSDIYRSPFFQDRLEMPVGGGIRMIPPDDESSEDFGDHLIAASDIGTALYGSAKEMLALAYKTVCDEWRNEGGELPEESALWWEARNFFEAYDKNDEDQGTLVRPGQGTIRPGTTQVRPGAIQVQPGRQYVDKFGGKPMIVAPPKLDFHEALAMLGEHPQLMRQFGLFFDLEVPIAGASLAPTGSVTLAATWTTDGGGGGSASENPLTVFQYSAASNLFQPGHKVAGEYRQGFYNLGSEYVQITGVDVDSLTIRTLDFAATIRGQYALNARTSMAAAMGNVPNTTPPVRPGIIRPPATGGIRSTTGASQPARSGVGGTIIQGAGIRNTAATAAAQQRPIALQQMLYSEALFSKMGDRPDTAAPPGLRSAGVSIARKDRYLLMQSAITSAALNLNKLSAPKSVSLYFEDMIRGYRMDVFANGKWHSLVTRQGSYTLPGPVGIGGVDEESWVSAAVSSDPAATGADKGKGKLHEVMVRWNGFSLVSQRPSQTLDQAGNLIEGGTQVDPRFPVRMQFKPHPGTLPILRFGRKYRFRLRLATVAGTGPKMDAASPGAPYETPELTYRRWESVPSPAVYENAQTKEGESAQHIVIRKFVAAPGTIEPAIRQLVPPSGEISLAETHGMFDSAGKPDPTKYAMIQERDNMQPLNKYVGGKVTRLPYFADPMALGACVQGAPHAAASLALNFPGTWPEQQSLQLEVRAGTAASGAAGDKFSLYLIPGEIAFPKLSSTTSPVNSELFGILEWLSAPTRATIVGMIPHGRVWTVTPFREATAVFATQVPEQKAAVGTPYTARKEGSTNSTIAGRIQTHSWTTSSADFQAAWTDDVDLLEEPKRTTLKQDKSGTAFKLKIVRGPTAPVVFQPFAEEHEFGDTKHHAVTYDLVAHSPFKQYFPASWPLVSNPEGTRFTETTDNAFTVNVVASRRPAPPQIEYIVPSYAWTRSASTDGRTRSSFRSGGSLRVYLRRPWFSSGNGEKLAVILLAPTTGNSMNDRIQQNTTRLGADPVFKVGDVPTNVTPSLFSGAEAAQNLAAPDMPGAYATAIPYPVNFDEDLQMWYADIIINAGSAYTPFVRLALARYQQHAIAGLQLSHIKIADLIQLQMSRFASVTFNDPAKKLRVGIVGNIGESAFGANRVFGTIEEKVGADDDTGWRTVLVDGRELSVTLPITPPSLTPAVGGVIRQPGGVIRQPPPDASDEPLADENDQTRPNLGGVQIRPEQPQIRPNLDRLTIPQGVVEGEITLPKARTETTYRLVIREYELFHTDSGEAHMPETGPALTNLTMVPPKPGARLVYVDVIPLS